MAEKWFEVEKGDVCQAFKKFVDTWDEERTLIQGEGESVGDSEVFKMKANDVPFSFRRVGSKHSLIFGGKAELIAESTYEFFKALCLNFFEESKPNFS
ncbi:hypothetical protein [Acinetobacter tandoii]